MKIVRSPVATFAQATDCGPEDDVEAAAATHEISPALQLVPIQIAGCQPPAGVTFAVRRFRPGTTTLYATSLPLSGRS